MSSEMEAGGLWGMARSLRGGKKNKPNFSECQNCGAPLTGRYCHECGQLADDFQRPFWSLMGEAASDLFALDGRLWKTVPRLLFNPGRITRQYIDGKRASQVPPFRMYLVASVLFFTTFFMLGPSGDDVEKLFDLTPSRAEACETGRRAAAGDLEAEKQIEAFCAIGENDLKEAGDLGPIEVGDDMGAYSALISEKINALYKEPQRFWLLVQSWAPRIAFLLLPFMVIGLGVLYLFKRGVYVYDHIVLALHFLTMLFLLWTISFALPSAVSGWFVWILMLYPFVYLYRSFRVVFDSGRVSSFIRTSIMWIGSFVVVAFLIIVMVATITITA